MIFTSSAICFDSQHDGLFLQNFMSYCYSGSCGSTLNSQCRHLWDSGMYIFTHFEPFYYEDVKFLVSILRIAKLHCLIC